MSTTANAHAVPGLEMHRIIYASVAAHPWRDSELEEMLLKWRRSNKRLGITGMLVNHEQSFLQLLEGPAPALNALFARLRVDAHHHKVVLLLREKINGRAFDDWTMGFARVSGEELRSMPWMADFLRRGMTLQQLAPRRALDFLTAFREGPLSSVCLRAISDAAES
jgi:hypothetical protein